MRKLLLILLLSSCAEVEHKVTYSVNCADCFVTYGVNGSYSQRSSVKDFRITFDVNVDDVLYLSGQNNLDNGLVHSIISENGTVLNQSKSEGAYVVSTAQYTYK
jgi:hypothetical protein